MEIGAFVLPKLTAYESCADENRTRFSEVMSLKWYHSTTARYKSIIKKRMIEITRLKFKSLSYEN